MTPEQERAHAHELQFRYELNGEVRPWTAVSFKHDGVAVGFTGLKKLEFRFKPEFVPGYFIPRSVAAALIFHGAKKCLTWYEEEPNEHWIRAELTFPEGEK